MEIEKLLLSWDEFKNTEFSTPYTFNIQKGTQELEYFGSGHLYDPANPGLEAIEERWSNFLARHSPDEIIVVIERHFKKIRETKEDNIRIAGESGLISFLAAARTIPTICFEPSREKVLNELHRRGRSKEILFYHEMAEMALQWHQMTEKPSFEEYMHVYFDRFKDNFDWPGFDFSLEHARTIHSELFNADLDENDKRFFYDIIDPAQTTCIINEISREVDTFRDSAVVKGIVEEWHKGKSIFVVYGSGHAVIQERALKELLK